MNGLVLAPGTVPRFAPASAAFNMHIKSEEWMQDALCAQVEPDVMFPADRDAAGARRAKKLCDACPVRQLCLDYALQNNIRHGIWGGMSPLERAAVRRRATWKPARR